MPRCRAPSLPVLGLLLAALAALAAPFAAGAGETAAAGTGERPRVVLRASSEDVARRLEENGWIRWIADRGDLDVTVAPAGASDDATGEDAGGVVVDVTVGGALEGSEDAHPVRALAGAVEVAGRRHVGESLALATRWPAPDSLDWVVVGPDVATAVRATARVLVRLGAERGDGWDFLVLSPEQLEHRGRFVSAPGGFSIDPATEVDQLAEREAHYRTMEVRRFGRLEVRGPSGVFADAGLLEALERTSARLGTWAERIPLAPERPVEVVLEADHEAHGRHRGQLGPTLDPAGRLHWVPGPDAWQLEWGVARVLVERSGLAEGRPWLADGAALWLSRQWWGRELAQWKEPIVLADLLPTADELAESERSPDASTVFRPAVAALLLDEGDAEASLEARWRGLSVGSIRHRLEAWSAPATSAGRPRPPGPRRPDLPLLRGVSLAMANGLEIGYHARALDRRLERLEDLGANAVSIMPFAYQPRPDRPELRFLNRRPSSETDVGAVHAARRARAAGFVVLWKPHIWVSHESWPGEIEMGDAAQWGAWWRVYRRFVLHHAVLAREAGAEILSLGVELGRTTSQGDRWAELARSARLFFPGALTYAGNWHDDYESFPAWDLLDFVGVDAYFPLGGPEASMGDLVGAARRLAGRLSADAARFGRPVLLTEVGFAARRAAWVEPHREGGEPSVDDQARAWRALLEGLGHPDWLAGLFAWKVFSADLGSPGDAPDFRILDRPAEAELGRYFRAAAER